MKAIVYIYIYKPRVLKIDNEGIIVKASDVAFKAGPGETMLTALQYTSILT